MEWLRKMIHKLFKKNSMKMIEEPKNIKQSSDIRNNFVLNLRQNANLEQDDGNGYKIMRNIKLEDMI